MITIIFGAGASYGSGDCHPNVPPLGKDLFKSLEQLHGAFYRLNEPAKKIFREEGFEAGMSSIENNSEALFPLQKELAIYLSRFHIGDRNAYVKLFNKIKKNIDNIRLATLNYDLLIEQALARNGMQPTYSGDGEDRVELMKIHGSSNFLPKVDGVRIKDVYIEGAGTFIEGTGTRSVATHEEVKNWCLSEDNNSLCPVISMYAKGKQVLVNTATVNNIKNRYAEVLGQSELIVICGVMYSEDDLHVWDPIINSGAKLLVVDPCPGQICRLFKSSNVKYYRIKGKGFDKAVKYMADAINEQCRLGK